MTHSGTTGYKVLQVPQIRTLEISESLNTYESANHFGRLVKYVEERIERQMNSSKPSKLPNRFILVNMYSIELILIQIILERYIKDGWTNVRAVIKGTEVKRQNISSYNSCLDVIKGLNMMSHEFI
ncbi:3863_t:CDS:2 [Rhizophagus irregularis]|nr:3863_t:CDS:2 [Rhizophagus irregularis]